MLSIPEFYTRYRTGPINTCLKNRLTTLSQKWKRVIRSGSPGVAVSRAASKCPSCSVDFDIFVIDGRLGGVGPNEIDTTITGEPIIILMIDEEI